MDKQELKQRLIAAALYTAVAERGGLDNVGQREEIDNAHEILDDAVRRYAAVMDEEA